MILRSLTATRLRIRRFTQDDLAKISAILDACFGPLPDGERAYWLTWQITTYEVFERMNQPPYGDYAVETLEGDLIGSVGLVQSFGPFASLDAIHTRDSTRQHTHSPEVGMFWAIAPDHREQGYAREAASALASWAFEQMNLTRLVATTERENLASIAVMKSIGMTVEHATDDTPEWFDTIGVLTRQVTATSEDSPA